MVSASESVTRFTRVRIETLFVEKMSTPAYVTRFTRVRIET